jgi:hypothetical protein
VARQVRQHVGSADLEQRTDQAAATNRDPAQAARTRALQEPHDDGLGLIVGRVAERDAGSPARPGDALESGVPRHPGRRLRRASGPLADAHALDDRRAAEPGGERLDERRVGIGVGPEPVVDVADHQRKRAVGRE